MNQELVDSFKLDFVGIGFPRSGTTWLSYCLSLNEEIDLSKYKEMHFFMTPEAWIFKDRSEYEEFRELKPTRYDDYVSRFANDGRPRGEFSTYYVYDRFALLQMKEKFPDIKVLLCLRNPIDFLESAYRFIKSSHVGYQLSDNMLEEVKNVSPVEMHSIQRAYFFRFVKDGMDIFGPNLKIVFTDDIREDYQSVLEEVFSFLGVGFDSKTEYPSRVNESQESRSELAMRVVHAIVAVIKKTPFRALLFTVVSKENFIQKIYNLLFKKKSSKVYKFSDKERHELRELMREDTEALFRLVGREF